MEQKRSAVAPLGIGVTLVLVLMIAFTTAAGARAVFGGGSGLSDGEVCVDIVAGDGLPDSGAVEGTGGAMGLRDGVRSTAATLSVCDTDPDAGLVAWQAVHVLPGALGLLAFLGWLLLLLRGMRRDGFFADRMPAAVDRLGQFVIAWSVTAWVISGFAKAAMLRSMSTEADGLIFSSDDFPIVLVLVGLGLITLGRVLEPATALRRDSEATI